MTLKLNDPKNEKGKTKQKLTRALDATHAQPFQYPPPRLPNSSRGVGKGDAIIACMKDYTSTVLCASVKIVRSRF